MHSPDITIQVGVSRLTDSEQLCGTHPIIAYERAEVGRLEVVKRVDELGAEHGVDGREAAAREDAVLQEGHNRHVLGRP